MQGKVMMVNQVSAQGQTCFGHQKVQIRQKLEWKFKQKLYHLPSFAIKGSLICLRFTHSISFHFLKTYSKSEVLK
jgi:hypothetical protein